MYKQAAMHVGNKRGGQVWCRWSKDWIVTFYDENDCTYYMVGDGRKIDVGDIERFKSMYPTAWLYKDFSPLNLPPHSIFR
ncbi:MAG: hypothetical protein ABIG61_01960 [Planctomycetota bacterium]